MANNLTEDFKLVAAYAKAKQKKKANFLYLSPSLSFSYNGFSDFVFISSRGVGKTVVALETAIILKRKYGYENVKCYYFRITDRSIQALLRNNAEKAVDPYLVSKYGLRITRKNNIVYDDGKPLYEAYPLVSAGSEGKGVNLYDCNFLAKRPVGKNGKPIKRFIVTLWDEFLLAEGIERKSVGDPVEQYKIYREAILRDAERLDYNAVYNFYLANYVSECATVTGTLFNFIPNPAITAPVKLTRKHTIIWNIPITEAYRDKRSRSYNANILDYENDPNYSLVQRDLSLIKPKNTRIRKLTNIIKFSKLRSDWFAVYDNIYIRCYRGEGFKKSKALPMRRYLDEQFDLSAVNNVIARFDARGYLFCDIKSQALFQARLKQIKQK